MSVNARARVACKKVMSGYMFEGSELSHGHFGPEIISFSENFAFFQNNSDFFIFLQIFSEKLSEILSEIAISKS